VIWMRIAAVFVVRSDHVRAEAADDFYQGTCSDVE